MKSSFVSVGIGLCLLLLVGCAGNAPSRYYVLSPLTGESKVTPEESCVSVGIGPIKLPEYVNRPQVVTRTTPNELVLSYFDLWAEPLSDSVPRTLAEDVARLLCTKEVVLFPWRPSQVPDYRVEVELLRMDGVLGRTVSLEAWWSVSYGAEKARVTRKSSYSEPATGQDYENLVQAHSRALAALSRDIVGALKELPPSMGK
jgi:uncharacterized lipoprotein YmbA